MGVTVVVIGGVTVVVSAAHPWTPVLAADVLVAVAADVPHGLVAGMLHTNLLSQMHLLSSHFSSRFIFKTQFSVVLPFG